MSEYCDWQPGKLSNDSGWAWGMAQWHFFYRYRGWMHQNGFTYRPNDPWYAEKVRAKFVQDFPEMTDWRFQLRKYLSEIQEKTGSLGSVKAAIDSWNADPAYMSRVSSNVSKAKELLSL